MKKKILLLFSTILSSIQYHYSQTTISGGLVEGTWTKEKSPYLIEGAILINNLKSLEIEPGVEVEFQGNYKFTVLGTLNAQGTVNDSIIFTAKDKTTGWLGVRFEETSNVNETSNFSYCKFEYGRADSAYPLNDGGGLFLDNYSKVTIANSLIENCLANSRGGGICCLNGSSPIIINNTFRKNTAAVTYGGGGAIYCSDSSPHIEGNLIINNTSGSSGGGIYNYENGSPTIINNTISYNIGGGRGGGIRSQSNGCIISNNIITFNESNGDLGGGGIYITRNETVTHNIIANNKSVSESRGGGGIFCAGTNPLITNNLIVNNSSNSGGGIYFSSSGADVINNTIANNTSKYGGAITSDNTHNPYRTLNPTINNSILWGNRATLSGDQVFLEDEDSDPNFYFSNIEGGLLGIESSVNTFYLGEFLNNINSDPNFINPSSGVGHDFDGVMADWNFEITSPCINQIESITNIPQYDLAGNPRVIEGLLDIGCYEFQDRTFSLLSINSIAGTVVAEPVSSDGKYDIGQEVTLTANAEEGYLFDSWEGYSETSNSLTIIMDEDKTITALFSKIQHTLTTVSNNGLIEVDINPIDGTYDYGAKVTLTAFANEGYQFYGWEGYDETSNSLAITMDEDKTVTAMFSEIQHTLTTVSNNDEFFINVINVYPNPADGFIKIDLTNLSGMLEIEIFNSLSKKILTTNESIIDISNLEVGIYFLKVTDQTNRVAIKKIIKK